MATNPMPPSSMGSAAAAVVPSQERSILWDYVPTDPMPAPAPPVSSGSMGAAAAATFPSWDAPPAPVVEAPPNRVVWDSQSSPVGPAVEVSSSPAAMAAAAAPERMSALDTIYGRNAQNITDMEAFLAANPIRTVSFANPDYPLAQEALQTQKGAGKSPFEYKAPERGALPEIQPGESEFDYQQRVQAFVEADRQAQIEQYLMPAQLGDTRDIGKVDAPGLGEAQRQVVENVGEAEIQQQVAVADAMTQNANAQRALIEADQRAFNERLAFAQQQRDAITQLQETEKAARQKVASLEPLDAQRYFKSMTGGQRFFGILGAMLGGSIGIDVVGEMRKAAMDDLEEQKANANQAYAQLDAATGAVQQQSNLYQDLLRATGDEAAASSMYLKMYMENDLQQLDAQIAKTTEPVMRAELMQKRVELEAAIRAEDQRVQTIANHTPQNISTSYDPIGRRERKRIEKEIGATAEQQRKLEEKAVDIEEKATGRQFDRETKLLEKGVERETKIAEKRAEAEGKIKERTIAYGQVEQMGKEFLAKRPGEMYTVGIPGMGEKGQRITEEQFFTLFPEFAMTAIQGGSVPEETREAVLKTIEGDWSDFGDEDRRARIQAVVDIFGTQRRYLQQQIGSENPAVERAADLPSFRPE